MKRPHFRQAVALQAGLGDHLSNLFALSVYYLDTSRTVPEYTRIFNSQVAIISASERWFSISHGAEKVLCITRIPPSASVSTVCTRALTSSEMHDRRHRRKESVIPKWPLGLHQRSLPREQQQPSETRLQVRWLQCKGSCQCIVPS